MVKTFTVWTSAGIEGYNPPDYYRTLDSNGAISQFLSEFPTQLGKFTTISIDNELGRIVIPYRQTANYMGANVILIKVTDTFDNHTYNVYFVGTINSFNVISADALEINYTVDWFTTSILNYYSLGYSFKPTAKTMLARRLTAGEFTYSDEGLTPVSTTIETKDVKCTAEDGTFFFFDSGPITYTKYEGNLFSSGGYGWGATYYVIYNSPPNDDNDTDYLIKCLYVGGANSFAPNQIASTFSDILSAYNRTKSFNPNNILFIGLIPIAPQILIRGTNRFKSTAQGTYLGVYGLGGSVIGNTQFYLYMDEESVATFYNKQRIEMADGVSVYDVPYGKAIPDNANDTPTRFAVTPFISESLVSPTLTLKIDNKYWGQSSTTMTLPIYAIGLIKDSDAIYKAEERDYQKAMLSLQSQNELASGIIGGINQGAMISAFSRNQTSTGTDKGVIGGGMAVMSAGFNYLYQDLYANKKSTEINDIYNRCKPDVLAQDGCISTYIVTSNAGLRVYKYDDVTIANILAYQSAFGYQTNKVFTDKDLSSFVGYVQGDVLLKNQHYSYDVDSITVTNLGGFNTTIAKYIKDMFNYGVYFTKVV